MIPAWLFIHLPALVVAVPLFGAFLLPLIGKRGRVRNGFSLATLVVVEFFTLSLAYRVLSTGNPITYVFGAPPGDNYIAYDDIVHFPIRILFQIDSMSALMGAVATTVFFICVFYSWRYMEKETYLERYYAAMFMMLASMLGMIFTADMFNLFVFLEILSISSTGLIAYFTHRADSSEGALKFLAISSLSALLVLLAVGLLYGQYNALNIAQLSTQLRERLGPLDLVVAALLIGAFATKCGTFPMHQWLPDAYSVAPAPVSGALVLSTQTSLYALLRVIFTLFKVGSASETIGIIILVLGLLTMLTGVFMAIPQKDIQRLIAYLAISQIGFMLLAVGIGYFAHSQWMGPAFEVYGYDALRGGIFQIFNDALYMGLLFLSAGAIFYRTGTRNLDELGGLGRNMKVTAVCFLIGALAISGIPPFNGFASKLLIFESVYYMNPILTILALLVSILTLAAIIKAFASVFMGPPVERAVQVKEVPGSMTVGMIILAIMVVFVGLFPSFILEKLITPAADSLIHPEVYVDAILNIPWM
jgi:multicomponent Na+:H+ antiporter subunit D